MNQREIKFRAWDTKYRDMASFEKMQTRVFSISDGIDASQFIVLPNHKNVELMQYTGLKDKSDKEIYEGDVVKLDSWEGVQQIKFIEGAFCLADKDGEFAGDIHYIHHAGIEQAKIIGNIYENPELLK